VLHHRTEKDIPLNPQVFITPLEKVRRQLSYKREKDRREGSPREAELPFPFIVRVLYANTRVFLVTNIGHCMSEDVVYICTYTYIIYIYIYIVLPLKKE